MLLKTSELFDLDFSIYVRDDIITEIGVDKLD